jgi:hypothetical protein
MHETARRSNPAHNHTFFTSASCEFDGTIDAPSTVQYEWEKENVVIGALVQMVTLGLILVGAAVVLFGSIFDPRRSDPMGMFGLPSVCTIACRPASVKNRATRPIETVSRRADREAA